MHLFKEIHYLNLGAIASDCVVHGRLFFFMMTESMFSPHLIQNMSKYGAAPPEELSL